MLAGVYSKDPDGGSRFVCEENKEIVYRQLIQEFPDYPFPYSILAFCLKEKSDSSWKSYAKKAIDILKITVKIDGHKSVHEEQLKILKESGIR